MLKDEVVLHIDCDTIVLGDILPIMQEYDIAKPICACNEYDIHYKSVERPYLKKCHQAYDTYINVESNAYRQQKRLGIQGDFHYFNAGVMLMNLEKWREEKSDNNRFGIHQYTSIPARCRPGCTQCSPERQFRCIASEMEFACFDVRHRYQLQ